MATVFITLTPRNEMVREQLSNKEPIERYHVHGYRVASKLVAESLEKKGVSVIRTTETSYKKKKIYALLDKNEIPVTIKSSKNGPWQIQITDINKEIVEEKQRVIMGDLNNRFNQKNVSCTWEVVGKEIIV